MNLGGINDKNRPAKEWASAYFYRPIAHQVVLLIEKTAIAPTQVVVAHSVVGMIAAICIAHGQYIAAGFLIQIKSVLDGVDGQLARRKHQESELGRYLDTVMDFLVNIALFTALYFRIGHGDWVLLGFLGFTLIQSWDFNVEYLYRLSRGETFRPKVEGPDSLALRFFRGFYQLVFAPQDQLIRLLEWRLFRIASPLDQSLDAKEKFWGRSTHALYVNLGLSSLHLVMSLFLWFSSPRGVVFFANGIWIFLCCSLVFRIIRFAESKT